MKLEEMKEITKVRHKFIKKVRKEIKFEEDRFLPVSLIPPTSWIATSTLTYKQVLMFCGRTGILDLLHHLSMLYCAAEICLRKQAICGFSHISGGFSVAICQKVLYRSLTCQGKAPAYFDRQQKVFDQKVFYRSQVVRAGQLTWTGSRTPSLSLEIGGRFSLQIRKRVIFIAMFFRFSLQFKKKMVK